MEKCNRDGDSDSDDPLHNKEDLLVHFGQDTHSNGSSSRLGNEVGSSTLLSLLKSMPVLVRIKL